jgi:hypothetical protein
VAFSKKARFSENGKLRSLELSNKTKSKDKESKC